MLANCPPDALGAVFALALMALVILAHGLYTSRRDAARQMALVPARIRRRK